MTELDKIAYTKMFVDKLANGINPLDDTPVPEQDLIRQVRISHCFSYVSGILGQILANGGIQPAQPCHSGPVQPFSLSPQQLLQFSFSDEPLPISYLAQRINDLVDRNTMKAFNYHSATNWLVEIGMLVVQCTQQGSNLKVPTDAGKEIGIVAEEYVGQNGAYLRVRYNRDAQQFILDHLGDIQAYQESCKEMRGKPWTNQQDEFLYNLCSKHVPVSEIARALKRSSHAVRTRMKDLGLDHMAPPIQEE